MYPETRDEFKRFKEEEVVMKFMIMLKCDSQNAMLNYLIQKGIDFCREHFDEIEKVVKDSEKLRRWE